MRERRARFIAAHYIDHWRGVSGRLDIGNVELPQFLNVTEDDDELPGEFFFLVGCKFKTRQIRDVFDIKLSLCHARKLKSKAQS